jgi:hypothetical protein
VQQRIGHVSPSIAPNKLIVPASPRPCGLSTDKRLRGTPLCWTMWWLVLFLHLVCAAEAGHYTKQWSVHIDGGDPVADQIADKHGFINRGKVSYVAIFSRQFAWENMLKQNYVGFKTHEIESRSNVWRLNSLHDSWCFKEIF